MNRLKVSKSLLLRYAVFIAGLYFLAMGVALIVRSSLGVTPISSINYVVSLHAPVTLGMATFGINVVLIIGQLLLLKGIGTRRERMEVMMQIPFSVIFSTFIDLNMALTAPLAPPSYLWALGCLLLGCTVQGIGVVLELKPNVVIMSAEGFVKFASRRFGKEFGRLKVTFDVTLITLATLLSLIWSGHVEGVREGSVIAALLTGYIVTFLSRHIFTRRMARRLIPALR